MPLMEQMQLRELNTLALYTEAASPFEAYLDGEISLDLIAKIGDNTEVTPPAWLTAGFNAFGYAPAIDMPRWYSYQGTKPLKFTVNCYLRVVEDFNQDITEPLKLLFSFLLPSRTQSIDELITKATGKNLSGVPLIGSASKVAKDIYFLNVPEPMNYASDKVLKLEFGGSAKGPTLKFHDVIVTGVSLKWGKLILEDGYPERVNITLNVESTRNATTNLLETIFV